MFEVLHWPPYQSGRVMGEFGTKEAAVAFVETEGLDKSRTAIRPKGDQPQLLSLDE